MIVIHTIGDKSLVSRPERFTLYVKAPNNNYAGGRVSPWNILGLLSKQKHFFVSANRQSFLGLPVRCQVAKPFQA
jgi:hypothetical protein